MSNSEVLKRSGMTGIECMITKQQLQWVGHVTRMNDRRLPKASVLWTVAKCQEKNWWPKT